MPYDAYAVTATGIGFSIARSIPWAGPVASELFFGGAFPTLGSLARLYTIHIFIVPSLLAIVIGAHLLIIVKQKHTQPGLCPARWPSRAKCSACRSGPIRRCWRVSSCC